MKVLSLFDGMSCGMLAMMGAGVPVDRYVAYEIDKYAVKTSLHNFPQIEQMGDVFAADFTQYQGFDFGIGGSPCTFWSIAQSPDKRETTASGIGWELFSQFVRMLREAKPRYFIYENNKSMSKAIRDSIRETFGFEEICINSALVSAQNRQRFYWVGKYNPETDWYDRVEVEQPEDRGILLKDIVLPVSGVPENAWYPCGYDLTGAQIGHIANVRLKGNNDCFKRAYSINGKSPTLTTVSGGHTQKKIVQEGRARDLLPVEYARLQTVPEWYDFSCVSPTQAYKLFGNGWTVQVIVHLVLACLRLEAEPVDDDSWLL